MLLCVVLGYGKYHIYILLLCGWAVSSDAVEVLSVSFLLPSAMCDLHMSSQDKGWLSAIVFVGKLKKEEEMFYLTTLSTHFIYS